MLVSMFLNYIFGLCLSKSEKPSYRKGILIAAVLVNIGILAYYKYANFFIENIQHVFHTNINWEPIPLPIGISFYTFQAMSYVIDVYRRDTAVQRSFLDLSLYVSLFPQLVAGPIVRYNTVAEQIKSRIINSDKFAYGIKRFVQGLAKKVLIANQLGELADLIFSTGAGDLTTANAWIGIIAYTLQIYYDFSGYSDMAIGLGKMFGFDFEENFNYPYISRSISEFWRRWHISLGTWFRDYVYIPLGGNRTSGWKIYRNLLVVWTITGFWHGASWTFVAWGFYYGFFICLEKAGFSKWLASIWKPIQHAYVLIIVMIGWVFFRADHFDYAFVYIKTLMGLEGTFSDQETLIYFYDHIWLFVVAILFALPIVPFLREKWDMHAKQIGLLNVSKELILTAVYFGLLIASTMYLVNSTYNPFIYFRF